MIPKLCPGLTEVLSPFRQEHKPSAQFPSATYTLHAESSQSQAASRARWKGAQVALNLEVFPCLSRGDPEHY